MSTGNKTGLKTDNLTIDDLFMKQLVMVVANLTGVSCNDFLNVKFQLRTFYVKHVATGFL